MNPPLPSLPRSREGQGGGVPVGDRVERPNRAADPREELWRLDLRAQGAGVDEDDSAGDRVEGGAEMQMMVR